MPGTRSIQAGETAEVHKFSPDTKFQPILHKSSLFFSVVDPDPNPDS